MVAQIHLVIAMVISVALSKEFGWMQWDAFDELDLQFRSTNAENCRSKMNQHLLMPEDVVTQIPKFNELQTKVFRKNRTNLIHLHNMALNRALFSSYILQKMNSSNEEHKFLPNIHYFYLSQAADVNANPTVVNGSAVYFDNNCYYPNWITMLDFNKTLPLFAPRAWRWDDTFDMDNYLREPTLNTAFVMDGGSGHDKNYTHSSFKMNPWYSFWLPDDSPVYDSTHKYTWSVNVKYSNETGKFVRNTFEAFNFFGPNYPGTHDKDDKLPVRFTRPYFDCGRSNKWVVSAVSPITDFMPRYSNWTHLRRPRYVGVVVMDVDFETVDFNSCGVSPGNPGPSYLAGIHKCKKNSGCKHTMGYGFHRGGYRCKCNAGFKYPNFIEQPYYGSAIEQSTLTEYREGFNCTRSDHLHVLPIVDQIQSISIEFFEEDYNTGSVFTKRSLKSVQKTESDQNGGTSGSKHRRRRSLTGRPSFDQSAFNRVMSILRKKSLVSGENCKTFSQSSLVLPGDVGYGVHTQFKYQASTALRLSHFLSSFLQNVEESEHFGYIHGGGRLHHDHLFGEVLANVMADFKILSSGVFYEPFVFHAPNESAREFFGPYAYRKNGGFFAIDTAGFSDRYTEKDWYVLTKSRWKTNAEHLQTYKIRPMTRSDINGSSSVRYEYFPMTYKAPNLAQGNWMPPRFKCDNMVDVWIMTYAVPFFRKIKISNKVEFAGVVTIDVPLDLLEINPCPQPYYIANAFKNTARCHMGSTTCRRIKGFRFSRTSYGCDCKIGYEYPFRDRKRWIAGSLLESEYEKKVRGMFNRFDSLRCRVAAASQTEIQWVYILYSIAFTLMVINICID